MNTHLVPISDFASVSDEAYTGPFTGEAVRTLILLCLWVGISVPALALESVTVNQLGLKLSKASGKSDQHTANQISKLELTERVSQRELEEWSRRLPGEKSRAALLAVASASAFLAPPPSDIVTDVAPDKKLQGEILLRATAFVNDESKRMPNFLAERVTTRFQDAKWYPFSMHVSYYTPKIYHLFDRRLANVRYLAGEEEEIKPSRSTKAERDITLFPKGLTTWGAFGPLLPAVMGDILESKVGWKRWERSHAERLAVFRYFVPQEKSHYTLEYCCMLDAKGAPTEYRANPTYHGEITIEPETGHIVRIMLVCDVAPGQVISAAAVELEYGAVEIAGQGYFLPLRGVSTSTVPITQLNPAGQNGGHTIDRFTLTSINDLRFQNYSVFRSEMRIVLEQSQGTPEP